MRAHFSQLLGAGEVILWFQEGRFGSPRITRFAFMILGFSVFWAIIVSVILWLGLSLGTPASHPWWVWSWNVIVYCAVIFLPVLAALELLRSLKSSVHVLTQKRLIMTNARWSGYSLKIGPIESLRLDRRENGEANVLADVSPHSNGMQFFLRFVDQTILSNIENPDLFASVLARHGRQTNSNSGAVK
jgi:hypothetical protein